MRCGETTSDSPQVSPGPPRCRASDLLRGPVLESLESRRLFAGTVGGLVELLFGHLSPSGNLIIGTRPVQDVQGVATISTLLIARTPAASFVSRASFAQPNGKVVEVGTTAAGQGPAGLASTSQVAVERLNADNTPDKTFNGGQELVISLPALSGPSEATALAVDAAGNVIVAGATAVSGSVSDSPSTATIVPFVVKVTSAGQVDTTFTPVIGAVHDAPAGVADPAGYQEVPSAVVLPSDGRILVAGATSIPAGPAGSASGSSAAVAGIFIRAYGADGTPQAGFGTAGEGQAGLAFYPADFVDPADVRMLFSGSDDAWYAAGSNAQSGSGYLLKLTEAGAAFPGFGGAAGGVPGVVTITYAPSGAGGEDSAPEALTLQPDGKVVVAGTTAPAAGPADHIALTRLLPDGSADASFGTAGVTTVAVANAMVGGVQVQPDGQIDLAGAADPGTGAGVELAAFRSDGTPQASYGTNGTLFFQDSDNGPVTVAASARPDAKAVAPAVAERLPGSQQVLHPQSAAIILLGINLAEGRDPDGRGILGEGVGGSNETRHRVVPFDPPSMQVLADEAQITTDRKSEATALASDRASARATAAADKATVAADRARLKADRHNFGAENTDRGQLAADLVFMKNHAADAAIKLRQDQSDFAALLKMDKALLTADRRASRQKA